MLDFSTRDTASGPIPIDFENLLEEDDLSTRDKIDVYCLQRSFVQKLYSVPVKCWDGHNNDDSILLFMLTKFFLL